MLGESGGRSKGNPTASQAQRRASQRQRAYIDRPADEYKELESRRSRRLWIALAAVLGTGAFILAIVR